MRVFILALSVLGILVSANVATAGPSTTERDLLASADPAISVLDTLQHQELLSESVSTARASLGTSLGSSDKSDDDRPARRRGAGHHRSGGGPGGLIGGVVGGLFGRR